MPRRIVFELPSGARFLPGEFPPTRREYLSGLEPDVARAVRKGIPLTAEQLKRTNTTEVLRLAGVDGGRRFPAVAFALKDHLGLRGLPIKLKLGGERICLRKHQVDAIEHARKNEERAGKVSAHGLVGSILKLEMGLGKTLFAISWALVAPRPPCPEAEGGGGFPTLVVASKTVALEWRAEGFEKFFGDAVSVLYLHKDFMPQKAIDGLTRRQVASYDFVVTTYDFVVSASKKQNDFEDILVYGKGAHKDHVVGYRTKTRKEANDPSVKGPRVLFFTPWERVIADESQRFANPSTMVFKAMMALYGRYKMCLTGTPIRNYDTDIWSQLMWCGYDGCTTKSEWKAAGISYMKKHKLSGAILSIDTKDTDISIPPKHREAVEVKLSEKEKEVYEYVHEVAKDVMDQVMQNLLGYAKMLALITRLRQICIAPYIITKESKRGNTAKDDEIIGEFLTKLKGGPLSDWVRDKDGEAGVNSGKMRKVVEILSNLPKDEKVLVFSMYTSALDLVALAVRTNLPSIRTLQLDGDTPTEERKDILEEFKKGSRYQALLMTYKVGSEGLNITRANHVVLIEPWWTSSVPAQAEARAHRPGQTRDVYVYDLFSPDTIEERVLEICDEKRKMAENYLEGTQGRMNVGLDKHTMGRLLR